MFLSLFLFRAGSNFPGDWLERKNIFFTLFLLAFERRDSTATKISTKLNARSQETEDFFILTTQYAPQGSRMATAGARRQLQCGMTQSPSYNWQRHRKGFINRRVRRNRSLTTPPLSSVFMPATDAFVKNQTALWPHANHFHTVYATLVLLQGNAVSHIFICRIKTANIHNWVVKSQYTVKHYALKTHADGLSICISCETSLSNKSVFIHFCLLRL